MENRYVGDIGDFGKYGLLRALSGSHEAPAASHRLRLGIAWYLFPDESHTADGKFTGYLADEGENHKKFRACDPALYDALRRLVTAAERNVVAVRQSEVLPCSTAYFEPSLSYSLRQPRSSRQATRANWINGALEATSKADVVFVDPDNGISETANPWRKNGPKFVFFDDLRRFAGRGQSLVIYHHLSRQGTHQQQIERWSTSLRENLGLTGAIWPLRYRRGSARVFFVAPQERHESVLETRIRDFLDSPWRAHFDLAGSA